MKGINMKSRIMTLVLTTLFVLIVTSVGAHHKSWPPKEYHSYVVIHTTDGSSCPQIYCQTEKEAQAILQKVEDCITGKIKTVIRFRDSVLKPSVISYAQMRRKYNQKGDK